MQADDAEVWLMTAREPRARRPSARRGIGATGRPRDDDAGDPFGSIGDEESDGVPDVIQHITDALGP